MLTKLIRENIDKLVFDCDGTIMDGTEKPTLLGRILIKLQCPIRVLSVTSKWDKATLEKKGFNIAEFKVPNYEEGTLTIDMESGTQAKVVAHDEYLVDDYYQVEGGSLIRYSECIKKGALQ